MLKLWRQKEPHTLSVDGVLGAWARSFNAEKKMVAEIFIEIFKSHLKSKERYTDPATASIAMF